MLIRIAVAKWTLIERGTPIPFVRFWSLLARRRTRPWHRCTSREESAASRLDTFKPEAPVPGTNRTAHCTRVLLIVIRLNEAITRWLHAARCLVQPCLKQLS